MLQTIKKLVAIVALTHSALAFAQQAPTRTAPGSGAVGVVVDVQGTMTVTRSGGQKSTLQAKAPLAEGDALTTGKGSFAKIKMVDGAEMVLRPESSINIEKYKFSENSRTSDGSLVYLLKGGLRAITGLIGRRNPTSVAYRTNAATVGIRGTVVSLIECNADCADLAPPGGNPPPDGTYLEVISGSASLTTKTGAVLVTATQHAYARNNHSAPTRIPESRAPRAPVPASMQFTNTSDSSAQGNAAIAATTAVATTNAISSDSPPTSTETASSVSDFISSLPATAAGPTTGEPSNAAPTATTFGRSVFSVNPSSSISGGGGRAVSRN